MTPNPGTRMPRIRCLALDVRRCGECDRPHLEWWIDADPAAPARDWVDCDCGGYVETYPAYDPQSLEVDA